MKKLTIVLLLAIIPTILLAACSKKETVKTPASSSSAEASSAQAAESAAPEAPESGETAAEVPLDKILMAIAAAYGEGYPPNGEIPPEVLESEFGLTPDLYEAAEGEMAMISAHNDRVVVAKAVPGKADALEQALKDARQKKIDDTLQYPANIAKTNAAKVVRHGDYIAFLLVGVPNNNLDTDSAEAADYAEAEVQKAVDAFNSVFVE